MSIPSTPPEPEEQDAQVARDGAELSVVGLARHTTLSRVQRIHVTTEALRWLGTFI